MFFPAVRATSHQLRHIWTPFTSQSSFSIPEYYDIFRNSKFWLPVVTINIPHGSSRCDTQIMFNQVNRLWNLTYTLWERDHSWQIWIAPMYPWACVMGVGLIPTVCMVYHLAPNYFIGMYVNTQWMVTETLCQRALIIFVWYNSLTLHHTLCDSNLVRNFSSYSQHPRRWKSFESRVKNNLEG